MIETKRPTCIVTGGAGFIGCALSSELTRRFERVIAIDSMHPQVHTSVDRPKALAAAVEFVVGDVAETDTWERALDDASPSCIVHLAAETGTGQSLNQSTRHVWANLMGTSVMLDTLSRRGIVPDQFILTSSRAVYGEGAWRNADGILVYPGQRDKAQLEAGQWDFPGLTFEEFSFGKTVPAPTNIYAATKLAQEHILSAWALAHGSSLDIARLQNVYGPGQALQNSYTGIVCLFARLSRAKERIELYEDGEMLRDFVFIQDVASALLAAIDAPHEGIRSFDVGSGQRSTLAQAAHILSRHYGAPEPRVSGAYRHGDVRHAACDIAPTLQELAWAPRWPLEKGLLALCDWMEEYESRN
ncbi:NAD(P)-dependent oxidoreductase [Rhizobium sp. BK661]|uniref:NAD-dependent epimerase/dehydratase family protein n=1 Tax=Rhizobium sp. BK661 TaxID=2586991 RepID=UPI002166CD86|nr:NAD(P)-dependent oxidoreductase [Rhizobium sp. BK661]MCS3744340.1 dTDP-L-rhamnose 4-epimerase [Rhizobium sp. BK661]